MAVFILYNVVGGGRFGVNEICWSWGLGTWGCLIKGGFL